MGSRAPMSDGGCPVGPNVAFTKADWSGRGRTCAEMMTNSGGPERRWHLHCSRPFMQGLEYAKAARVDGHVLIVEDERLSRKALALLLRACGYHTLAAASAEEALRMLSAEEGPDIALVDV